MKNNRKKRRAGRLPWAWTIHHAATIHPSRCTTLPGSAGDTCAVPDPTRVNEVSHA
jgi:hypothetical protein